LTRRIAFISLRPQSTYGVYGCSDNKTEMLLYDTHALL